MERRRRAEERIEMAEVVARAIETAGPLLKKRRHRLTLLTTEPGLRVNVDRARLTQVVANLLTNAARYSESGSQITVRVVRSDRHFRLSVEHQGAAISVELPVDADNVVHGDGQAARGGGQEIAP